jgi:hypothetical protein
MALWLALAIVGVIAAAQRNWLAVWTTAMLLANWAMNTSLAWASGTQFNWAGMAAIDYMTACLILGARLTRWQIAVSCLYAGELVGHAARAWVGVSPYSDYIYWWYLHYLAWAQLWAVAGWVGHDLAKAVWDRIDPARRAQIAEPLFRLMGWSTRAAK